MTPLHGGNILRLPLDAIRVGTRLRAVSAAQVANLLLMAEDTGITTPIHVRKVRDGYDLIDGAHRLAAATELGLPDIACLVFECRQDEARAMEASNNLGAARMTPLQTAVFAASWKRDYYAAHPERKPGVFKGNQHKAKELTAESALTTAMCEAFGIQQRRAYRILAVGERLTVAETGLLDRAARIVALDELEALSKVGEPEERLAIVKALAADPKARVVKARKAYAVANGRGPVGIKDPVEEGFKALSALWSRVPEKARLRFLDDHEAAISARMVKLRDARIVNGKLGLPEGDPKGAEVIDAFAGKRGGVAG
jgi:ParB family transcriptional regulator, chromosome partitioning protein